MFTNWTISKMSIVLSKFKSAELSYSLFKIKLIFKIISWILIEPSWLISPCNESKVLKICQPAFGWKATSPNIFDVEIKYSISELPGMILGVGSVTDAKAVSQYMLAGANFVVTPVFREDIARICNRKKLMWSAGCSSLTEIAIAEEFGCELIKLFPGDVLGAIQFLL